MSRIISMSLTPLSDCSTPLQADTIFGHLCWKIRRDGESVDDFLKEMEEVPPFVISNVFPEHFIPRPRFEWEFSSEDKKGYSEEVRTKADMMDVFDTVKAYTKKVSMIGIDELPEYKAIADAESAGDEEHSARLFRLMTSYVAEIGEDDSDTGKRKSIGSGKSVSGESMGDREVKTTLDRVTSTTLESQGPYTLPIQRTQERLWILLKVIDEERFESLDQRFHVRENLRKVFEEGYGKRKSIGKGVFKAEKTTESVAVTDATGGEDIYWSAVDYADRGSRLLLLSHFSPKKKDPTTGLYEVFVKYGKMGEERSISGAGNFYKRPIMFLKEGAVFSDDEERPFLGRMISDVCEDEKVRQYAYGFVLAF